MEPLEGACSYLKDTRGLPAGILHTPRFEGCARIDARGNVAFPHVDEDGLCGDELKNRTFTGFAAGGEKGRWLSHESARDQRLVFCESAIECLSHAALFPDAATRYASLGGKPNPKQPGLIAGAIKRMPAASQIVAAMNADDDGRQLADIVCTASEKAGVPGTRVIVQEPIAHNDWNDQRRANRLADLPTAAAGPLHQVRLARAAKPDHRCRAAAGRTTRRRDDAER